VRNLGPAGGGDAKGLSTFHPHSSPAGIIWCGDDVPAPFTRKFLVTRFGNLLSTPEDVGFDVLSVDVRKEGPGWVATVETVLAPLGRPLDIIRVNDRILVLEYTRPTDFKNKLGWLPGRVIELAPAK
jgi:glucose/arabinose dehydrogenase